MKRMLLWMLLLAMLAAGCGAGDGAADFPDQSEAIGPAVSWLVETHQNDDGGYTSFSTGANAAPSDIVGTLDAMLALAAAGEDTDTPLGYLTANSEALFTFAAENGGQAGKVLLALVAAGVDPREFAERDFVTLLTDQLDSDGAYNVADPFKQSLAVLGLVAAGEEVPASAVDWLKAKQATNGSWDDGFGTLDNTDATAMAIMALVAAGQTADDAIVARAVDFLAGVQATDGGWAYAPGLPTSANSTALAGQALSALGENWYADGERWAKERTPLAVLLAFQSESGAFQSDFGQGPLDDFYATVQALPALSGQPFPLASRAGR